MSPTHTARYFVILITSSLALACESEKEPDHDIHESVSYDTCDDGITAEHLDCDGDGFTGAEDCNDFHAAIYPGASEVPCNDLDDDCDDNVDEISATATWWFEDNDGDGFGDATESYEVADCEEVTTSGLVTNPHDCDDANDTIHPDATEVCDEIDNDCDGMVDDDDPSIDGTSWSHWLTDEDGDTFYGTGHWSCAAPADGVLGTSGMVIDCDDTDGNIHPTASEVCDEVDNDCDGDIDEDLPEWYSFHDNDGDGEGDPTRFYLGCSTLSNYVLNPYDCDDTDPGAKTGSPNDLFIDSNGNGNFNCWSEDIYEFDAGTGTGSADDWLSTDSNGRLVGFNQLDLCGYTDASTGSTVGTPFGNANGNSDGEAVWGINTSGDITEISNDACHAIGLKVGDLTSLSIEVDYTMNDTGGSGLWVGVKDNIGGYLVTTLRYPYIATPPLGMWWFDEVTDEVTEINEVNDASFGGASGTLSLYMADIMEANVNGSGTIVDDDNYLYDTGIRITPDTVYIGSWDNDLELQVHAIRIYNPDGWREDSSGFFIP